MSKRPTIEVWMPLHFSEVNKATSRMSEVEECAYLRLLRDYWLNGAPPNDDDTLARIVRYPRAKWLKVRPAVAEQFDVTSGRWVHEHTDGLRTHAQSVSQSKRRGSANATPNATQMRTHARVDVPISVDTELSNQEGSTDYQVGEGASVIPLAGRAGR